MASWGMRQCRNSSAPEVVAVVVHQTVIFRCVAVAQVKQELLPQLGRDLRAPQIDDLQPTSVDMSSGTDVPRQSPHWDLTLTSQ